MTKKPTPTAVAPMTPAEHAAQAGFTNWATVCMAEVDSTEMFLTTANGDTDTLLAGSQRAEQVLSSYEAVYTIYLNEPTHPNIALIAGAGHE